MEVILQVIAGVHLPELLSPLVHLPNTLEATRVLEILLQLTKVLVPQRHPEAMDLSSGNITIGVEVGRLVRTHGDFRVPCSVHGPLVDVGRSDNDVFVVHCHKKQLDYLLCILNVIRRITT